MTWDQMHLMITRSTTPDLIILFYKLSEFLDKQFTEGKDYIKECELDLFYEMKVKQQCKQFINKLSNSLKQSFISQLASIIKIIFADIILKPLWF